MKVILVTGSMGSGKSSVIHYLEKKAYPVFRSDVQAKEFLKPKSPCYADLRKLFPDKELIDSEGEFDRKKLAQIIFKNPEKKQAIEALIHPLVQEAFKKFISTQEAKQKAKQTAKQKALLFYEAPLISKKIFSRFDKTILLTCPESIKKIRLIKKGWKEEELKARWLGQMPDSEVLDIVDFIIDNQKDLNNSYRQMDAILAHLKT